MSLVVGVAPHGYPPAYVVDMRGEIITTATQFAEAIHRWLSTCPNKIIGIRLSPTQEYCLRLDSLNYTWNDKENRQYTLEEVGLLREFMGYKVFVDAQGVQP